MRHVRSSALPRTDKDRGGDALLIGYEQYVDNAHPIAFVQRTSSTHWTEEEISDDRNSFNNFMDYEDGQEESDS
ncbi:hypothetical protein TNCV_4391351 [Trichonephila clavipes]|nr:hypothetical protein TNCV_4391351 [Trichonephila clavipes]